MAESSKFSIQGRHSKNVPTATMVGRTAELRQLEAALNQVRETGRSAMVTLLGAAGVGKTRLVHEFLTRTRHKGDHPPVRVYRGFSRQDGPPYEMFARVLRARFGIVEGMDPEAAKGQIRSHVARVLEDRKVGDVLYFLGQLLDLSFVDSPLIKAIGEDPVQVRGLRRAVLKRFFEADCLHEDASRTVDPKPQPMVLVFDDTHFAKDEALDLLAFLSDKLLAPVLLVAVGRPEVIARRDDWARVGGGQHHVLDVAPLTTTDAAVVMHELLAPCQDTEGVEDLVDSACAVAGGNPSLLEQMVHLFLDSGVIEVVPPSVDDLAGEETWSLRLERAGAVRLPLSVEDAVQARIASLSSEARSLLEGAAAMGSVFWLGGLLALGRSGKPTPAVWNVREEEDRQATVAILEDLVDRDFILRLPEATFAGDEEFVFKHNLEREALLRLTSPATARRYHQIVADWMAFKEPSRTNDELIAVLGKHREAAGQWDKAAESYLQAAEFARAKYAHRAAFDFYSKALKLLGKLEYDEAEVMLRVLHRHGDLAHLLGHMDDAWSSFRAMQALAYRLGIRSKGGIAHGRLGRLYRETGQLPLADRHMEAAEALFEAEADSRGLASVFDEKGKVAWLKGNFAEALAFTERALILRRAEGDAKAIALSLNNLGLVYQDSGRFHEALEAFEQALRLRRESGDLVGVSVTLNNLGTVAQDQGDDPRALQIFQEALDLAKESGDRVRAALISTNLGETLTRLGDATSAVFHLRQAEEMAEELGDRLALAEALRALGQAYLAQQELVKARECSARAVELFSEGHSPMPRGVALRTLAEVTAVAGAGEADAELARMYLAESMNVFEAIGNEAELARSYRAMAKHLLRSGLAAKNPAFQKDASRYAEKAEEIFSRLRGQGSGKGIGASLGGPAWPTI